MLGNSDFAFPKTKTNALAKDPFTDEVLWNSFKKGNELALSILYKKYIQLLYSYGLHTIRDHDIVMDCLQDLFSGFWQKRESISSVQSVKSYLFKSFRRSLIHRIVEQRKHSAPLPDNESFEFMPSIESVLIEDEIRAEQTDRLKKCIQSLTKGQREVIYLKFYNELSYQEIAEITELQIDSVYNLVSKTIELLRRKLQVAKPHIPFT